MKAETKQRILILLMLSVIAFSVSCKRGGTLDILGPADETEDAGKIVFEANQDLTKIKILYEKNEGKREELKAAMEKNDATTAKKIANTKPDAKSQNLQTSVASSTEVE